MDEKRFIIVDKQGSGLTSALQEIVDRKTGVHYQTWPSGYAGGITPLLGADGRPVITARGTEYDV